MEVDVIIQMGFFIRDLHRNLAQLHSEQYGDRNRSDSFTVYRGQGLLHEDFEQLFRTKGGLMSFNNFLSTSRNEAVSRFLAESNGSDSNLVGILFKITVNPSTPSTPFGNVNANSNYQHEEEILFSMRSVFRIGKIEQINENNRLWEVELMLTSDRDAELHALTKQIQAETFPGEEGWYRLGQVLIKLGHFDKAKQVYDVLLTQTSDSSRNRDGMYFHLGWIKDNQGKYQEAIAYYAKSLQIIEATPPCNYHKLASCFNNLGMVYNRMGEYPKALSFHEKALRIRKRILLPLDPDLATS